MDNKSNLIPNLIKKMIVAIGAILFIATIHIFRVGSYLNGNLYILYYSFFSDIIIPIGIYILLCINYVSFPFLKNWIVKALIVFIVASSIEVAQAFGIPVLGNTFDPLDFIMFAIGTSIAVLLDKAFSVIFPFWTFGNKKGKSA
ncbi:MAG: DUF2809 domain-containing protein [Anaerolineaceae bacterium]|nr:DUF2809 domain-containing protein [Anaerolineaceae bacterium]